MTYFQSFCLLNDQLRKRPTDNTTSGQANGQTNTTSGQMSTTIGQMSTKSGRRV